eukprot:scaffold1707_cov357-Prasinococcus_capsulatus_cf.AAC.13
MPTSCSRDSASTLLTSSSSISSRNSAPSLDRTKVSAWRLEEPVLIAVPGDDTTEMLLGTKARSPVAALLRVSVNVSKASSRSSILSASKVVPLPYTMYRSAACRRGVSSVSSRLAM